MIPLDYIERVKKRFSIIGNSEYLNKAIELAILVAPTDASVLITGENGTGKESFSQIIHGLSPRSNNKFLAINCGAIPEGTIDSELFGHKKGAFTGALEDRKGYFEEADEGTIFLDEIADLPLNTQARLLRVLEYKELIKVGQSKIQKVNLRLIAATNVDLLYAIKKGKFREDLYYRLSTVPIQVPPLRNRQNDIMLLFCKFANDFADKYKTKPIQLDTEAQLDILSYPFPGNVRQLKNIVEQISILEPTRNIDRVSISKYIPKPHEKAIDTLIHNDNLQSDNNYEREFLYKAIFQLKNEVNLLKEIISKFVTIDTPTNPENREKKLPPNLFIEKDPSPLPSTPAYPPVLPISTQLTTYLNTDTAEVLSIGIHEKELIMKSLEKYGNNRKKAAASLGISERTLYRKIKTLGLE